MTPPTELLRARRTWARERRWYRALEILPGALVWASLVGVLLIAFWRPLWAILFIIVFDLFWLLRIAYLLVYLLIGYRRYRLAIAVDWRARLMATPGWERLVHLIIIPTYGESLEVLNTTFAALARVDYPRREALFLVLACEERDRANIEPIARILAERYREAFGELLITFHPDTIPGEIAGKGSNIAWAGRRSQELIDAKGIHYHDILVSSFDADTQPSISYFSYLSVVFLNHPNRLRTSYQPIPLFNNNIWQSPAIMRVLANSTTFWLMTETLRPDRLFTFSSHSMPWQALVDVDFWQNDIVTEDSRIFLQGLIRYDGDYTVTPLYLPLSMDTVLGQTFRQSVVNQYKQIRRWAYGVENFPFMVWNFVGNRRIPLRTKIKYTWNQLEGVYSWATAPIIIFVLSWLPTHLLASSVETTALAQNSPFILSWLVRAAMAGLIVSAIVSTTLLPPRPPGVRRTRFASMLLQWVLFPFAMIAFGSIPAIDAQTRLMFGKYLGFWVTPKARKNI